MRKQVLHIVAFAAAGVNVEVVMKAPDAVSRIEHAESLGAMELLEQYASNTSMPADALAGASAMLRVCTPICKLYTTICVLE